MRNQLVESGETDVPHLLFSVAGVALCMSLSSFLSVETGLPIMIASFGASTVILFSYPKTRVSRPKNVVLGHVISAIAGVLSVQILGFSWLSITVAVTLAFAAMTLTDTVHPPGGATAIVAVMSSAGPLFILAPVLAGAVLITGTAHAVNLLHNAYSERVEKPRSA